MGLALVRLGLGLVLGVLHPAGQRHGVRVMAGGAGTGAAGAGVSAGLVNPTKLHLFQPGRAVALLLQGKGCLIALKAETCTIFNLD